MPDVLRLCNYWRRYPPAHLLLAGWLGYGPAPDSPELSAKEAAGLMTLLGPAQRPPGQVVELARWADSMRHRITPLRP